MFIGPFGALGDRRHAVVDADGMAMSARRNHAMLGYRARYLDHDAADGLEVTLPDGRTCAWDDPGFAAALARDLEQPTTLVRSPASVHDAAPVHVLTTASLAAASEWTPGEEIDARRFRANVIVDLDDPQPFAEAAWPGQTLSLGDNGPVLGVIAHTERCAVTTFDPDTLERDGRVLAGLARDRENLFGVYARVLRPGWARVGDTVAAAAGPAGLTPVAPALEF